MERTYALGESALPEVLNARRVAREAALGAARGAGDGATLLAWATEAERRFGLAPDWRLARLRQGSRNWTASARYATGGQSACRSP